MKLGIIGGTGALGSAMAKGWLDTRTVQPADLWAANRSGHAGPLASWPDIVVTTDTHALVERSDVIVIALPPDQAGDLALAGGNRLIISVMAGVTLDRLETLTSSRRVVRAMSNPAASMQLAYSPWIARDDLPEDDCTTVSKLLTALGAADRVDREAHIDRFTAITGPVPGFVAFFADCLVRNAAANGVPEDIADRAVRQLLLASAMVLRTTDTTPAQHVRDMLDYDGTTAAGLRLMSEGPMRAAVDSALDAAVARAGKTA